MRMLKITTAVIGLSISISASAAQTSYKVCHGEVKSVCDMHPYDRREVCNQENGLGKANYNVSCEYLCGKQLGEGCSIVITQAEIENANACGYSWFEVRCE